MDPKVKKEYVIEVIEWAEHALKIIESIGSTKKEALELKEEITALIEKLNKTLLNDEKREFELQEIEAEARLINNKLNTLVYSKEDEERKESRRVPIGKHSLPPLPYSYDALEPAISKEIMKLHYEQHHKSYVEGLNKAELEMEKARQTKNFELLKHWEREAAFHGSGHYLHSIFWFNMAPKSAGKPSGALLRQITEDFGSFERFKSHFTNAAEKVEGVGWALLVWAPRTHRLEILQTEKHQFFTQWDTIPLLVLDMWEHAYYLQYKNKKADYIKNWWNIVNWQDVEQRFNEAKKVKWDTFAHK